MEKIEKLMFSHSVENDKLILVIKTVDDIIIKMTAPNNAIVDVESYGINVSRGLLKDMLTELINKVNNTNKTFDFNSSEMCDSIYDYVNPTAVNILEQAISSTLKKISQIKQ